MLLAFAPQKMIFAPLNVCGSRGDCGQTHRCWVSLLAQVVGYLVFARSLSAERRLAASAETSKGMPERKALLVVTHVLSVCSFELPKGPATAKSGDLQGNFQSNDVHELDSRRLDSAWSCDHRSEQCHLSCSEQCSLWCSEGRRLGLIPRIRPTSQRHIHAPFHSHIPHSTYSSSAAHTLAHALSHSSGHTSYGSCDGGNPCNRPDQHFSNSDSCDDITCLKFGGSCDGGDPCSRPGQLFSDSDSCDDTT